MTSDFSGAFQRFKETVRNCGDILLDHIVSKPIRFISISYDTCIWNCCRKHFPIQQPVDIVWGFFRAHVLAPRIIRVSAYSMKEDKAILWLLLGHLSLEEGLSYSNSILAPSGGSYRVFAPVSFWVTARRV